MGSNNITSNPPAPRPPFDQSALAARLRLTEAIRLRLITLGYVAKGQA